MTQVTSWPRARAYREAIQAPRICFSDVRLRAADIHTDAMGIPLVASGKSAVVFKATADASDIAIRCFTRAVSGQRLRYQALQEYLGPVLPPYMAGFTYRDHEMLVEGIRYPVVEMDWVAGDPLDVWVRQRLGQGNALADQAAAWLAIIRDMLSRGMAHGDFANDNCLVSGSELKLIDYDGCFIPGLEDKYPGESGANHFQHPSRAGYYAANMDAFPSLVIFLSLLALQDNASLWQFHTDKNLIFEEKDFTASPQTSIWNALANSEDARVGKLAAVLASMCRSPVARLPSLGQVTARAGIQVTAKPPWKLVASDVGESPVWLRPRPAPEVPKTPAAPSATASTAWLKDHVGDHAPTRPPGGAWWEQRATPETKHEVTAPDQALEAGSGEPGPSQRVRPKVHPAVTVLILLAVITAVLLLVLLTQS